MSYEIELVRCAEQAPGTDGVGKLGGVYPCDNSLSKLATLTGLSKADIWQQLPARLRQGGGWWGRDFIAVAHALGYNASPKFVPFESATPWPALLRLRETKLALARQTIELRRETGKPNARAPDYWYTVAFNQGLVYDVEPGNHRAVLPLAEWLTHYPDLRVTSMLSIWLDDKLHLTQADF